MERNSAVNRAILGRNIRSYQRNYHITDTLVLRDPRNVDPILEPLKKQRCTSAYDWTAYPEYRVLACLAQPAAEYSACWRGIRFQCQGNLQFPCKCAMCSFHFNGLRLGLLCLYTFCKFDQIFNLHFENPPPLFILYAKSSKYKSKFWWFVWWFSIISHNNAGPVIRILFERQGLPFCAWTALIYSNLFTLSIIYNAIFRSKLSC